MKTSAKGLQLIKIKELYRGKMYYCPANKPTIGYGHVIGANEAHLRTAFITEPEATALLQRDVVQYEQAVSKALPMVLTQNQFDACVCLCYNIGTAGFAGSTLVKLIRARAEEASIRSAWVAWCKMDGTRNGKDDDKDGHIDEPGEKQVAPGLVIRRKQEADLFFTK
ncbi:lysozyme [Hymenobacter sp. BT491]|uniref:lysozyme n=1 Tax=Hymenobacter sp. BT491 TaxID=2766779 RepID=UPI001653A244|nr:lysozyme [Hymenobacter sp. BT491]MBC6988570.1 lysozyme [Hymenobacter sp. BT491]